MKIDLKEILTDEFGNTENLAETIKSEIVRNLSKTLSEGINKRITDEVAKLIDEEIKRVVSCQMPSLLSELIDKEYTIVATYGSMGKTTTIRNQLISTLTSQMVYKPATYESDKNYFTKNVDAIMWEKMELFKKEFDTKVNEIFVKEALGYASAKLKKTLNI